MDSWQQDVKKAYTGFGAIMSYSFPPSSDSYTVYGMSLNYVNGLNYTWNRQISFSAANATGNLNITSIGLTGYKFTSSVFLKMNITDALYYKGTRGADDMVGVRVVMYAEGPTVLTNLQKSNFVLFQIGTPPANKTFTFVRYYESTSHSGDPALNSFVYELRYTVSSDPRSVRAKISVVDTRGIKVTGEATLPTVKA
jgi:hypothetical protein